MGSTEPRAFSPRARWAGGNGAENYRAVRSRGSQGNWRLRVLRELALRSGQERRRCDHGLWMLWSRMAAGLKGRPKRVQAIAQKFKVSQHNKVDDDATIVLEYPDATVIIEASWDWPYSMGQVQVFGPKGSLLATPNKLFYRPTDDDGKKMGLEGEPVALAQGATSNPVAYFVDR